MERKFIAWILSLAVLLTAGCSIKAEDNSLQRKPKPVRAITLHEESHPVILNYSGIVGAESIKKLAFKSSGKIDKVLVKKGEQIHVGQPLVQLDIKDLSYNQAASQGQLQAARAQYEKTINGALPEDIKQMEANVKKAEAAYQFSKDNYEKMEHLYAAGALSKNDFDKAKLELDIKEADLHSVKEMEKKTKNGSRAEEQAAAKGQLEQAAADYNHKTSLLEDALLKANADGYVVDILYESGEIASAGYPVIVVRDNSQVLNAGISSKDFPKITLGAKAKIRINNQEIDGEVTNIGQTPDNETLTYPIEVSLPDVHLPIGAIGTVDFIIGETKGIWIPISAILSNGEDYVFVEKDGQAFKREIFLGEIKGNLVRVEGLSSNDRLIVEGMKKIKDQELVSVLD